MPVNLKKHTFTSQKFSSVIQEAMRFMTASPVHPLPPADRFPGAGVYAVYYCGDFDHYKHIAVGDQKHANTPIYVGKAVPPGFEHRTRWALSVRPETEKLRSGKHMRCNPSTQRRAWR